MFHITLNNQLMINQLDEDGLRHGPWEYYHDNIRSIILCKGNYKNGRRHGLWEYHFSNGVVSYKGEHKSGRDCGLWYEQKYAK